MGMAELKNLIDELNGLSCAFPDKLRKSVLRSAVEGKLVPQDPKDEPVEKLLERITEGDTVVVESLSRLGRSTKDLIWLMETFNAKGVNLVSLKESIDTTTSTGKLLFTLMSALAQFERDVLADRTREGLAAARARGRKGGRPQIDSEAVRKAVKLYHTRQYTVREITDLTGVKPSTLYKNLRSL